MVPPGPAKPLPAATMPTTGYQEPSSLLSCLGFGEPSTAQLFSRDAGQVGLDIENWGPIQHIYAPNMQLRSFTVTQFDGSQANRVRPSRRTGRKHSMRPIVRGRVSEQIVSTQFLSGRPIELPDDE